MQSHTIPTTPDTTLHVLTSSPPTPTSTPTLLFVHFWGGSPRTFSALAARLSSDFPLILPALRGWGASASTGPADPALYKIADSADDLAAVIAHLRREDAALFQHGLVLLGHSMGAKIAQLLAARGDLGSLLKGLVLVGPAPLGRLELPAEMRSQQITAYASRESAEGALRHVLLGSDVGADEVRLLVDDCVSGGAHAKTAWPQYGMQEDYEGLLTAPAQDSKLTIPVAVVVGALDKVETPEKVEERVVRVLKTAGAAVTLTVLDGVGHLVPVEAPGRLEEVVRSFSATLQETTD